MPKTTKRPAGSPAGQPRALGGHGEIQTGVGEMRQLAAHLLRPAPAQLARAQAQVFPVAVGARLAADLLAHARRRLLAAELGSCASREQRARDRGSGRRTDRGSVEQGSSSRCSSSSRGRAAAPRGSGARRTSVSSSTALNLTRLDPVTDEPILPRMKIATVILAAGLGTRMKSDRAKVLHAVAGRPLIYYPVALARRPDRSASSACSATRPRRCAPPSRSAAAAPSRWRSRPSSAAPATPCSRRRRSLPTGTGWC